MIDYLRHQFLTRIMRLSFCSSCSGYFHPLCTITVTFEDSADHHIERYTRCEPCYARDYNLQDYAEAEQLTFRR